LWSQDPRKLLFRDLERRIRDARVVAALRDTPRERYVPEALADRAWDDVALPLAHGQTISQPTMVALLVEAMRVRPQDVVLDVGTGSGYQAAILARLGRRVFGIEILLPLAHLARRNWARDPGVPGNAHVVVADGWRGFPGRLRFDAIAVAAAADEVPPALVEQLAPGGRLVVPVGPPGLQDLVRVTLGQGGSPETEYLGACAFVPLVHGG
jgi:protein-L-isoaspartate(D-aspartate) O-methyltransferase